MIPKWCHVTHHVQVPIPSYGTHTDILTVYSAQLTQCPTLHCAHPIAECRPYIEAPLFDASARRDLTQQLCRFERMQFSRIIYSVFVYRSERFWSAQDHKRGFLFWWSFWRLFWRLFWRSLLTLGLPVALVLARSSFETLLRNLQQTWKKLFKKLRKN